MFGINCLQNCSENCNNESSCNGQTGACIGGCMSGWMSPLCTKECVAGKYGQNCSQDCSRNCKDSMACDKSTGECDGGCVDGWRWPMCNKECDNGTYGTNCSSNCGHCYQGQSCDKETGACPEGCGARYDRMYCNIKNIALKKSTWQLHPYADETLRYSANASKAVDGLKTDLSYTGHQCTVSANKKREAEWRVDLGAVLGINHIRIYYRTDNISWGCPLNYFGPTCSQSCPAQCNNSNCHIDTGECFGCKDGYRGPKCGEECENNMYGAGCSEECGHCVNGEQCNPVHGTCRNGCETGYYKKRCKRECDDSTYGSNCSYSCGHCQDEVPCDKKTGKCPSGCASGSEGIYCNKTCEHKYYGLNCNLTCSTTCINQTCDAESGICVMSAQAKEEDGNLITPVATVGSLGIVAVATIGVVVIIVKRRKRRQNQVPPQKQDRSKQYENTTFHLSNLNKNKPSAHDSARTETDKASVDLPPDVDIDEKIHQENPYGDMYVNELYCPDFLIKDIGSVIMKKRKTENDGFKREYALKCHQYWPNLGNKETYGTISVKSMQEKQYAFYIIRKFQVSQKAINSYMVTQFHYTTWPDHGTPDPLCLVIFHSKVSHEKPNQDVAPTIVHCSAGIGRTGTYIALDSLYHAGKKSGRVNVAEYVKTMRANRMNMIQTYEQYMTVFLALHEALKAVPDPQATVKFRQRISQMLKDVPANYSGLRKEYERLRKNCPVYTIDDYKLAKQSMPKFRKDAILPLDKYGLYLSSNVPTRGSFINAIVASTYIKDNAFIVTHYPPQEDAVDFLRLITDHESGTVICMDPLNTINSSKSWLPLPSSEKIVSPYKVVNNSSKDNNVKTSVISIHKKGEKTRDVTIAEPKSDLKTQNVNDTFSLRSLVSFALSCPDEDPITVVSKDGASMCGVFCAVFNSIQQITMDDNIDVFTTVRQLQTRRPEFCSTQDEYGLIYQTVYDHLIAASDNVYYNQ
uniref:Receptor-type tyrosine-protein phosphatase T n=1 Tax=Magallana gigas TaxID=29159 RepID=A0A8W8NZL0_MAGGI